MLKDDCIFCKIIKDNSMCHKIAENEYALAFLDISGDAYGHTLVIPKGHFESMLECDEKHFLAVQKLVKEISQHYVENCGFQGVNIYNNTKECAGQSVMHMHFHIIPRKVGDGIKMTFNPATEKFDFAQVRKALEIKNEDVPTGDVVMYTDGACSGNPGIGGYAAILRYGNEEKVISGGEESTTNNRMELMGVIKGLQAIKKSSTVDIFSDSAYVVNAFMQDWITPWIRNGWKTSSKSEVLNVDLWKELLSEIEKHKVIWHKVKGHADVELNNRCDEIARNEVQKIKDMMK